MIKRLAITGLLLCSCCLSFGQVPWNGLLTTSRAIDWRNAGATIPTGTIPNCATQPSASIASINAAIAADVGGGSYCVVNIPAVSSAVGTVIVRYAGKANVILRGTGANSSILTYSGATGLSNCNGLNATYICLWNGDSSSPGNWVSTNSANWTGGLSQGSTVLTLSNTTNLKVGMQVVLYQTDPSTDPGNIWPCQSTNFNNACSWQGTGSTPVSGGGAGAGASESQMIVVAACNGVSTYGSSCGAGTSVTSATPIYMPDWTSGRNPKAAWGNTMPISNVGVEDLKVNDQSSSNGIFIEVHQANNWWLNGTGTIANPAAASDTNHILVWASTHGTAENCYMYGSYPASSGYGLDFAADSADNVAQNCITQHMDTGFITETGMANVFDFDYSIDNYFGGTWQQDDEYQHSAGDYYNLREGIEGIGYNSDNIHGTHWFNTVFRSYFSGFDPTTFTGGKNQSQVAMNDAAWAGYDNWVANAVGTAGYFSTYQLVPSSTTTCSPGPNTPSIYELGFSDSGGAFSPACQGTAFAIPNATAAQANSPVNSTMRFDNYDTVNGSVQRNSSEYATSAPVYPGLASPTTTIPASLYLPAGTPSWWSFPGGTTAPFPPTGPDVTGGNISGLSGHAWHGPAWNCYNIVNSGVTNGNPTPINFNRASCYTSSTPTAAAPSFSPASPYSGPVTTVTLSSTTPSPTITYCQDTTNTCTPSTVGTSVSFSTNGFIRAFTTATGYLQSVTVSWQGTIALPTLAAPTFSPNTAPNWYLPSQFSLAVTPTLPGGSTGCYTLDTSTPTGTTSCSHGTSWTSGPISVAANQTLSMIAIEASFTPSAVTAVLYTQRNIVNDGPGVVFDTGTGGATTISCPAFTPGSGEGITVEITYGCPQTVSVVSDSVNSGNYQVAIPMHDNSGTGKQTGVYYRSGTAASSTVVSVTLGGSCAHFAATCQAWKPSSAGNFTLDSPASGQQDSTGANPTIGSALTPTNSNSLALCVVTPFSQLPTAGSGFTLFTSATVSGLWPQATVQTTATATNCPYVMSSDSTGWTDQQAVFFFSPSGPPPPTSVNATLNGAIQ